MNEACKKLDREVNIMEVCGTHTVAIFRTGIKSTLPEGLHLLSGPGCPVCVTDQGYIDTVLELSNHDDCLIATYGDMIRVPGKDGSLEKKQPSTNIKIVLSSEDALELARENREKTVVFVAVGFETTAPATAVVVKEAAKAGIDNFCVLSGHKMVVPAMRALLSGKNERIDAFGSCECNNRFRRLRGDSGRIRQALRGGRFRTDANNRRAWRNLQAINGGQGGSFVNIYSGGNKGG
jgi:hydrogenase expression/formation protein HypD